MTSSNTLMFTDDIKVFDKMANQKNTPGPKGWVRVFFNAKKDENGRVTGDLHYSGPNLIVGQGRAFVAQKIFNVPGENNYLSYQVSHFAVGAGGATVNNDVVTLRGPYICDTCLTRPIALMSAYLNEPGGIVGDPNNLYNFTGAVKPIALDGSITIENSEFTDNVQSCTHGTKVKCTCVIPPGEPSGLITGQSVPISEAGLYFVAANEQPKMFAHVCFAPKWKEFESSLIIQWYILT